MHYRGDFHPLPVEKNTSPVVGKKAKKEDSSPMAVEVCSFDASHRAAPGDTLDLNLFADLPPVFAR